MSAKSNLTDFVALILTHGRPDKVKTIKTLRKSGYTGRIVLVIDNEDNTAHIYKSLYGEEDVVMFDKLAISKTFDQIIPGNRKTIVYARNASFEIAKQLGYRYFIQLDDDYEQFQYRFDDNLKFLTSGIVYDLDAVFSAMLDFLKKTPIKSVAMMQGGDFIGGADSGLVKTVRTKRKAMNSFICDTERPFTFIGRINEDVNTYTAGATTGDIFLSLNQVWLNQTQTQANSGGMTDVYLESGTYLKSFFTIICCPSAVKINLMGGSGHQYRLHHKVNYKHCCPRILDEKHRKQE